MNMILTSKCGECEHGSIIEIDKAHIKVRCRLKDKEYHYGEWIPCDRKNGNANKAKGRDEQHE